MRLNGDCASEEEEEDERGSFPLSLPQHKFVVGYALTSKKVKSFLQPKLEGLARRKGILFVAIDHQKSLSEQGPFDIVLHKLKGEDWGRLLEDYREKHPEVTVLDPPDAIQHLYNRQSMLKDVADLNLCDFSGKIGVPRQLVITKDPSSIPDAVSKAGLILPIVAKPLVADGTAKSHKLSLAYDSFSLSQLDPPLVLQEFVNHGGVLFKVYIVGEAVKVVRRFSLPDIDRCQLLNNAGVYQFPRVSCSAASADDADLDPSIAELPPRPLLERLARELRWRLGLRLFNIDIIREHGTRDRYYVIDINYFPGTTMDPQQDIPSHARGKHSFVGGFNPTTPPQPVRPRSSIEEIEETFSPSLSHFEEQWTGPNFLSKEFSTDAGPFGASESQDGGGLGISSSFELPIESHPRGLSLSSQSQDLDSVVDDFEDNSVCGTFFLLPGVASVIDSLRCWLRTLDLDSLVILASFAARLRVYLGLFYGRGR